MTNKLQINTDTHTCFIEQSILHTAKPLIEDASLVSNKIVDNSDIVWASPVSAAPTTIVFST